MNDERIDLLAASRLDKELPPSNPASRSRRKRERRANDPTGLPEHRRRRSYVENPTPVGPTASTRSILSRNRSHASHVNEKVRGTFLHPARSGHRRLSACTLKKVNLGVMTLLKPWLSSASRLRLSPVSSVISRWP
jgi:hypothetical protein